MPRKVQPDAINYRDEAEREAVRRAASRAGLSVSNYFRVARGLAPLSVGAPAGNKNAAKRKARPRDAKS